MKKFITSILFLAAALTLSAQDARQRTVETVVADVLAAMPANNATDFNTQMADLAAAAPASVVETAKMMKPAGEGVRNNLYEYALTGLASYASANPQCVDNVREGFILAIKSTEDSNNKAFLLNQFRQIAKHRRQETAGDGRRGERNLRCRALYSEMGHPDRSEFHDARQRLLLSFGCHRLRVFIEYS